MNSIANLNIAVAGAGLMGRLLAWRLLLQGAKVSLIEKGTFANPQSAAHTAAAMISPLSEVVVSERGIYEMGLRSLCIWPEWIKQLERGQSCSIGYQSTGSLAIAHPSDFGELEQFQQDLNFHLGKDNTAQWVDASTLRNLEPSLSEQFQAGLLLPKEAFLDNRALLNALLKQISRMGGRLVENQTLTFNETPQANDKAMTGYDLIIDCRGLGAKQDNTPKKQALRGVRGEVLWVETEEVQFQRPIRLMHPRYKLYIVPKPNNRFIIGATEIESEDRSPVTVQSMMELCSALFTLNPAFAEARIHELDANLRPSYLNNLPEITQSDTTLIDGTSCSIIHVNGLYRHGYLLAPYLVEQTEQAILSSESQAICI